MKNFQKLSLLLFALLVSRSLFSMEHLEGTVQAIEDEIEALNQKFDELSDRVAKLEEPSSTKEETTFEKCSADGTSCKKITSRKAHHLIHKGTPEKRIRRCRKGGHCNWVSPQLGIHKGIQQKFQELQKKYGIKPSRDIHSIQKIRGPQGSQLQFNAVRSKLNNLLAKDALTNADIKEADALIMQLKNLNPARSPSPEEYKEILQHRTK